MQRLKNIIEKLRKRKLSIALAESCSSGYASYLLTKTPGSSKVFKGGIIVYSLDIKNKLFGIPMPILIRTQGVSKKISIVLAEKIRKKFNTDLGASIVGFAGPAARKGVKAGTVFIALASKNKTISKKLIIEGNRDAVRKKASIFLIELLSKNIHIKSF